jgi:hypothetical protein
MPADLFFNLASRAVRGFMVTLEERGIQPYQKALFPLK